LLSASVINCGATVLSIKFDRKLRLDIGRYEFRSLGLSDGFLSRVVTMACFCDAGRIPDCRDALQILATTGARTSAGGMLNQPCWHWVQ